MKASDHLIAVLGTSQRDLGVDKHFRSLALEMLMDREGGKNAMIQARRQSLAANDFVLLVATDLTAQELCTER
jgi:hypothetical protein